MDQRLNLGCWRPAPKVPSCGLSPQNQLIPITSNEPTYAELKISSNYNQIAKNTQWCLKARWWKRENLQCLLGNHALGSGDSSGWSLANSEVRTPRSSPSAISFAAEHHTTKMTTLDCFRKRETPNWRLFMVASPFQTSPHFEMQSILMKAVLFGFRIYYIPAMRKWV